ncbi:MAG: hypothetical protein JWO65_447 [Sphingomonas bacterium]|nr:hypothetical protein [Sphingomonas bacterium]
MVSPGLSAAHATAGAEYVGVRPADTRGRLLPKEHRPDGNPVVARQAVATGYLALGGLSA